MDYKRPLNTEEQIRHLKDTKRVVFNEMTEEEAKTHPSQSVLLQCVGAGGEAVPEYTSGAYEDGDIFLVCSDGFRHRWSEKEMAGMFPDRKHIKQRNMTAALRHAVEEVMRRGEKDNITVIAIAP